MSHIFKFKSVRSRLTFWFMMVAIVPLLVFFCVVYEMRVQKLKEKEINKLSAIRDLKADQISGWLNRNTADLESIAGIHQIRKCIEESQNPSEKELTSSDVDAVQKRLEQFSKSFPSFTELSILQHETGVVVISSDKKFEGENRSKEPSFQEPLRTGLMHIQDVTYSSAEHRAIMTVSTPIRCLKHNGEHVIAVLLARIDLNNSLYPLIKNRTGLGLTGESAIVNRDGFALCELRWHEDAVLNLKMVTRQALRAINGETGSIEEKDYRGERVLAAYTHIPKLRWGFITKQDLQEVNSEIRDMTLHMLAILGISIAAVLAIAFLVAKSISKPVIDLAEVSKTIESGDLSVRNTVHALDELGYLSKTFNGMAESLQKQLTILQGSAELNRVMMSAHNLNEFYETLLDKVIDLTDSDQGVCFKYTSSGNRFDPASSVGLSPQLLEPFSAAHREGQFGKALTTQKLCHTTTIPDETVFTFKTIVGTALPKEIITIPILVKDQVRLVISLANLTGYSDHQLKIIEHVSTNIATALSNLMANEETARLADELLSKNTELKAQADELLMQAKELEQQSMELHQQNTELEVQRKHVEEASRLKSTFLSNMSHELRTPLNSVMALSKVLIMDQEGKLSEEELGYLEIIERNGKKLLLLINDILDLSKIEAGKVDINVDRLSPTLVIRNVLDRLHPIAKEKGIVLIRDIPENLAQIESDETKLDQILQNIIGNAVKFTDEGTVTVSASCDENRIRIRVADTGIGIPANELPYIFDEFRQVDGSPSRRHGGTGLGLAIANKTARLIKGELSAESSFGKGSTFTLSLPLNWSGEIAPDAPFSLKEAPPLFAPAQQSIPVYDVQERNPQATGGKQILMVEDNEAAVIQVKSVLEREGYIVDVARGGKQAIEYVQHSIPDGIILDLMMPEMDGFQVLEQIRSTEATAAIPVLVLTAKDLTSEDFSKLSANHIQQLVQKGDVDTEHLLFKIGLMLGGEPQAKRQTSAKPCSLGARQVSGRPKIVERGVEPRSGLPLVLVVEDNPDNMATIKAILKNRYVVTEATDGAEGVEKALCELPDLILLDIALPAKDGFTVLGTLRANEHTLSIPVIALTARAMKGDKEQILQAGFHDYIPKPIDPEELIEKMKLCLNEKGV